MRRTSLLSLPWKLQLILWDISLSGHVWGDRIILIVHYLLFTSPNIPIILDLITNNASNTFIQILRAHRDFSIFTSNQWMLSTALRIHCSLWLFFWANTGLGPCIIILGNGACRRYGSIFSRPSCWLICCIWFLLIQLLNSIELLSVGRIVWRQIVLQAELGPRMTIHWPSQRLVLLHNCRLMNLLKLVNLRCRHRILLLLLLQLIQLDKFFRWLCKITTSIGC